MWGLPHLEDDWRSVVRVGASRVVIKLYQDVLKQAKAVYDCIMYHPMSAPILSYHGFQEEQFLLTCVELEMALSSIKSRSVRSLTVSYVLNKKFYAVS